MSQTERDTAALQTLLADNVARDLSAQDIRDAIASALGGYAGLALTIPSSPITKVGVAQTPLIITEYDAVTVQSADANVDGSVANATTGVVTTPADGIYQCSFYASFTSSVNNHLVHFQHFKNGSLGLIESQRFIRTGSDVGAVSMFNPFLFTAGDEHDVRIFVDAGSADITFQALGFNFFRVG